MDTILLGWLSLVALTVLVIIGMPVGIVMFLVGAVVLVLVTGWIPMLAQLQTIAFEWGYNYTFSVIPMFLWMGYILTESGVMKDVLASLRLWVGRMSGGMAVATCFGSAAFGAMSASSYAAVALFNRLALPEMLELGYDKRLAAGVICAAGPFAYMIPPSTLMVIVGMVTNISVTQMLLAGYIPGILSAIVAAIIAYAVCKLFGWGRPIKEKPSLKQKIVSLKGAWGVILVILMMIGGLYGGVFTPTEAAAVGCALAVIIVLTRREFSWKNIMSGVSLAARTTGMLYAIMIGAMLFTRALAVTGLVDYLGNVLLTLEVSRGALIAMIMVMYLFMGMFVGALPMIMLTFPFVFPIITQLGFSPVWLGIILVQMIEIGALTPPVAMNLYVSKATLPDNLKNDISITDIFIGTIPFLGGYLIVTVLMVAFPIIVLFLPNTMMGG